MFRRNKAETKTLERNAPVQTKKCVPSIVSSDLSILGNLVSDGLVDVDGTVDGNVKADQVIVRTNGKVRGDITANVAHIYGEVQGIIRASSVYLYSSCRIHGIVVHQSLSVEDGAFIDGKLKRIQDRVSLSHDTTEHEDDENSSGTAPLMISNLRLISQ